MPQQESSIELRRSERRAVERRKVRHAFGSLEWTKEVMEHYVMWPKDERREQDRREYDRRHINQKMMSVSGSTFRVLSKKRTAAPLSDEELKMLKELPLLSGDDIARIKRTTLLEK